MFTLKLICFLLQPFKIRCRQRNAWKEVWDSQYSRRKYMAMLTNMDTAPFPTFIRHTHPEHWCSLWRRAVKKLPPSLQKLRSLAETSCAGKQISTFPACIYCFHTSLSPFVHHLQYQHRIKDSAMLLLRLCVIPKGKRAGESGAALCVHILSPPPCPFLLPNIRGQLYSCSYSSAVIWV